MRNETQKTSRAISFKAMLAAAFSPFSKFCRGLFNRETNLSVKGKILSLQKRKEEIECSLNLFAKEVEKIGNSELVIYNDEERYRKKFTLGLNIDVNRV